MPHGATIEIVHQSYDAGIVVVDMLAFVISQLKPFRHRQHLANHLFSQTLINMEDWEEFNKH